MTAPRPITPDTSYLVTRRCSERRMFLRPSPDVNQLVLYILAVAVERFQILVHAYCFLSNHFHLVVTDPKGSLPRFEQYLDAFVARACNALIGRSEAFWSPGSYNAVTLVELGDVFDKMAYTLANPVAAGLVCRGAMWPGLWSSPDAIGGAPIVVHRPDFFFRADGSMPEEASFRLVPPPEVEDVESFRQTVWTELERREEQAARALMAEGRTFLGVQGVLAQDRLSRPAAAEAPRDVIPRIACKDETKRKQALDRLKAFIAAHRDAWLRFASGARRTVFPHGTYWMRVAYGVECAPAG